MATPGVGEDIEDICSRCGETWHVVMAKLGDRIAKVVCKRCGGQHNFRGPNAAPEQSGSGGGGSGSVFGRRNMRRKPKRPEDTTPVAPTFDPNKPPRTYSAREAYVAGERVVHPTFGTGVVSATPGPGKVNVVFPTGARTLACAKAESNLTRPTAVEVRFADRPPDKP